MHSRNIEVGMLARVVVELALATFTLWLVVQNAALLLIHPWKEAPAALVVAGALVKLSVHLLGVLWPWMLVAAPTAGAMLVALTRQDAGSEARHV